MVRISQPFFAAFAIMLLAVVAASGGCGGSNGGNPPFGGDDASVGGSSSGGSFTGGSSGSGNGSGGSFGSSGASPDASINPTCSGTGLCTLVPQGCTTSLSGTVYDPAGKNPLYNVVVFVPNDPAGKLPTITPGTHTCNTCDVSIGNYVAATTTDAKGHFTLNGVPATTNVPFVVQTGKWRREVFLPKITGCSNNAVAPANSRLPKNRTEGSMPQMLLVTGGCDDLGCFMRSMGIDASEFSAPHGGGRLDIYTGTTLAGTAAAGLSSGTAGTWGTPVFTKQAYEYYDIAIFSCECAEHVETAAGRQALHDWLGEGGKAFASHYQYSWFSLSPAADFRGVATWNPGSTPALGSGNYTVDTSFVKGMTFDAWLQNVKAATGTTIVLNPVATSVHAVNKPTVRWIYDQASNNDTKYLSFLTPIGGVPKGADAGAEMSGPQYCGKAVFTDLHTSSGLISTVTSIPSGCNGATLTAQQDALEFLFFDLSACVAPDDTKPAPIPMSLN